MIQLASDAVVLLHLGFVVFVCIGGLLALHRQWWLFVHPPAAAWGVAVEIGGLSCPLTRLELSLRHAAGEAGYAGGFIDHYIWPLLYPEDLTRSDQLMLGALVVVLNATVYGFVWRRRRHGRHHQTPRN